MSASIVRPSKNQQFAHAAAAMGDFWARTRRNEMRRARRIRQMFLETTRSVVRADSSTSGARNPLR